jgi:hypothetical protein
MTTKERFQRDVAEHVMEVLKDDGLHRHIRFRKPGTMCMHFDLITWPGYLCYTGDMGTYVFRRLEDMFEFFRAPSSRYFDNNPLDRIDHRYWAEKLEASDKGDGHTQFDPAAFKRAIEVQRRRLFVEYGKHMNDLARQDFWASLDDLIDRAVDGEGAALAAVFDWEFYVHEPQDIIRAMKRHVLRIDPYEFPQCRTYTHRFTWCCYALRWGIHLYDQHKQLK